MSWIGGEMKWYSSIMSADCVENLILLQETEDVFLAEEYLALQNQNPVSKLLFLSDFVEGQFVSHVHLAPFAQ